jgi:hypothetical protein
MYNMVEEEHGKERKSNDREDIRKSFNSIIYPRRWDAGTKRYEEAVRHDVNNRLVPEEALQTVVHPLRMYSAARGELAVIIMSLK